LVHVKIHYSSSIMLQRTIKAKCKNKPTALMYVLFLDFKIIHIELISLTWNFCNKVTNIYFADNAGQCIRKWNSHSITYLFWNLLQSNQIISSLGITFWQCLPVSIANPWLLHQTFTISDIHFLPLILDKYNSGVISILRFLKSDI